MQEYMISHKKPSKIDERLNERAVGSMREILEHKQEEKEEENINTSEKIEENAQETEHQRFRR